MLLSAGALAVRSGVGAISEFPNNDKRCKTHGYGTATYLGDDVCTYFHINDQASYIGES